MEDVLNNRCQQTKCKTRATFGTEWGKATHCVTHASEEMEDVLGKRCEYEDCKKHPSFGIKWGNPTHCALHALGEMENVKDKRCQNLDCKKQPSFGLQWKTPTHCVEHASADMEDVINRRCHHPKCKTHPSFGVQWQIPTHCAKHASNEMENVVGKRCHYPMCSTHPSFGIEWQKPTHCATHALVTMENMVSKRCEQVGCKTLACFGYEWRVPIHCFKHASNDMKDVVNTRCQHFECDSKPSYGNHLTGRAFCNKHKERGQHWKITICANTKCMKVATQSESGNFPFTYCGNHAPQDFHNFKETPCLKCGFTFLCDNEQFCLVSCSTIYESYVKRTENELNDFLETKNLTFTRDKTLAGTCTKKRPDFVFDTDFGVVVIENDENQHKSHLYENEQSRMVELHQAFGTSVHFIRFNPDKFIQSGTGKRVFVELKERHTNLYIILKKILTTPENFFCAHPGLSMRYMYYDNFDTEAHFDKITFF
jgi:hypothetical protein